MTYPVFLTSMKYLTWIKLTVEMSVGIVVNGTSTSTRIFASSLLLQPRVLCLLSVTNSSQESARGSVGSFE